MLHRPWWTKTGNVLDFNASNVQLQSAMISFFREPLTYLWFQVICDHVSYAFFEYAGSFFGYFDLHCKPCELILQHKNSWELISSNPNYSLISFSLIIKEISAIKTDFHKWTFEGWIRCRELSELLEFLKMKLKFCQCSLSNYFHLALLEQMIILLERIGIYSISHTLARPLLSTLIIYYINCWKQVNRALFL